MIYNMSVFLLLMPLVRGSELTWCARRVSNPLPSVLETAALPQCYKRFEEHITMIRNQGQAVYGAPDRIRTCIFHPVTGYGFVDRADTEACFGGPGRT